MNEKSFRCGTEIAKPSSASRLRLRPAQLRQVESSQPQSIISRHTDIEIKTNPCFRLDLPLTAFRLSLPESYLLDFGLYSGFRSDSFVKLLAKLRYKIGFDIGISMNEII